MTKREAKRWACTLAADLLQSDSDTCPDLTDDEDPDFKKKKEAMQAVIDELRRRGGSL